MGHLLFLNINAVPLASGNAMLAAVIENVEPVSELNQFQYEYDSTHKATFILKADGAGNTNVLITTDATAFYAILSCCVLIK